MQAVQDAHGFHTKYKKYHSVKTVLAMFQCNTLCRYTKCCICSPVAKGYVPPCIVINVLILQHAINVSVRVLYEAKRFYHVH